MAEHGTRNWAVVEQHMVSVYGIIGRSGKQSRERWHNHLSERPFPTAVLSRRTGWPKMGVGWVGLQFAKFVFQEHNQSDPRFSLRTPQHFPKTRQRLRYLACSRQDHNTSQ